MSHSTLHWAIRSTFSPLTPLSGESYGKMTLKYHDAGLCHTGHFGFEPFILKALFLSVTFLLLELILFDLKIVDICLYLYFIRNIFVCNTACCCNVVMSTLTGGLYTSIRRQQRTWYKTRRVIISSSMKHLKYRGNNSRVLDDNPRQSYTDQSPGAYNFLQILLIRIENNYI